VTSPRSAVGAAPLAGRDARPAGTAPADAVRQRAPARGRWSPRARISQWLQARLPLSDTQVLTQRNVYILPTRAGLAFALTLVVMLLAAINYQLNLGFALTFLLAGAGIVSMHMTHNTLRGLTLHLRPPRPVFAGEPAALEVVLTNPGATRHALGLRQQAAAETTAVWCDVPAQGQTVARLSVLPAQRGWHAVPTLVIESVFPFGLFRAWSVWRPESRVLAWPTPETPPPPLPATAGNRGDEPAARRGEGGELDGVRPWRRGDTMRQVVWKKVARSGELVSRETSHAAARELWLDWNDTQLSGTEARLSRLAAWVLAAERDGLASGLVLPGRELQPGLGDAHRRAALDLLGQWT
jgi:uncharacterized protein (DUF58 family)